MSRDHGPVQPLEQRCAQPGHWRIEGYDVQRFTGTRALSWQSEWHIARFPHEKPKIVRTLGEARDWIREHR